MNLFRMHASVYYDLKNNLECDITSTYLVVIGYSNRELGRAVSAGYCLLNSTELVVQSKTLMDYNEAKNLCILKFHLQSDFWSQISRSSIFQCIFSSELFGLAYSSFAFSLPHFIDFNR